MLGIGFAAGMTAVQKALRIGIAVALVVALMLTSYCTGRNDGRVSEQLNQQTQINAALERDRRARDKAAEARIRDEIQREQMRNDYEDAIASAPGGANSPAAVALACERLRRSYGPGAELPAACGPQGGN